jgi:hypothetical protein
MTVVNLNEWRDDHQPAPIEVQLPSGSALADIHATFEATGIDAKSYARLLHETAKFYATLDDGTVLELVEDGG